MKRPDADHLDRLDSLFGPAAVMDLDQRGLLPTFNGIRTPVRAGADGRIAGALMGAALGNALGFPTRHLSPAKLAHRFGRITGFVPHPRRKPLPTGALAAEGRLLVSWAGRLRRHGELAAPELSQRLVSGHPTLRTPGQAIVEAVERLEDGAPWYAAGPDSYGNGALLRAVADGARWLDDPDWRPRSAALGAIVTHAHLRSVEASMVLAEVVAAGIADPDALADPLALAHDLAAQVTDTVLADGLRDLPRARGNESLAHESLTRALRHFATIEDGADAILAAVNKGGSSDCVAGIVGALVGARDGLDGLPRAWRDGVEHRDLILRRARRLAEVQGLPLTEAASKRPKAATPPPSRDDETEPVHIWFLLDRSGSMKPLHQAVVAGFNSFIEEHRNTGTSTRLTLVQFDGGDPFEVLVDGARLQTVPPLTPRQYRPRGMTPLYDAMGSLIDAAESRIARRAQRGKAEEDQLVVVFTDGMENASRRWDSTEIFARIEEKKAEGWTFVYLGANQDSYAVGAGLGVADGSVSNWEPTVDGHLRASESVGRASVQYLAKPRHARRADRDDFFGGVKEAERPRR